MSPRSLCVGRGGEYLRPSPSGRSGTSSSRPPSVARHFAGDEEVPTWPPRGARRSIPSAIAITAQRHVILPPTNRQQAYLPQQRSPCAAFAWDAAANAFGCRHQAAAAPHLATHHPSPGISPATKKSVLGLRVGRGGQYPLSSPSGRSSTPFCRPSSVARHLVRNEEVPTRHLRGSRWPGPLAISFREQRHLIVPYAVRCQASRR